jgi:hypothetical protein
MKRGCIFLLVALMTFSCSLFRKYPEAPLTDSSIRLADNDGLTFETAVIIYERKVERGFRAEYTWLKKNYPGYKVEGHKYSFFNNRPYDIITAITRGGEKIDFYFNIYAFYGDIQ